MRFYAVAILIAVLAPVFATVHMVSIFDFMFTPYEFDIAVGDTVNWTNNDALEHTVADNNNLFYSELLQPGDSFSHTFTVAADVQYKCIIFGMEGIVNVTYNKELQDST
ncbi:hypothetical protein BGZ58_005985, partial [Dissophora ornata]